VLDFLKNGALVAIIAHGLIGISLIWDKVLLKSPGTRNLFSYVFWLGAMSLFGVILVPFGYNSPSFHVICIAFVAGVVHLVGVFFYYMALKRGEASETLAVMGGFSPVATAGIAFALLSRQMSGNQLLGFALMASGGFVMFLSEKLPLKRLLPPVLLAAGLLGLVNVLERVVYDQTNFVTGYVWFTIGTFVGAMALLVRPSIRRAIFKSSEEAPPRSKLGYMLNRFVAGIGSFLVVFAISRISPSMVEAISGTRYVVIFFGAYAITRWKPNWFTEDFTRRALIVKAVGTGMIVAGLILAGMHGGVSSSGGPS